MKNLFFLLAFVFAGSVAIHANENSSSAINSEDTTTLAGPQSWIIQGGKAFYFDDGANCVYHVEADFAWGSDC